MDPASHILFGAMLTAGAARPPRRPMILVAAAGSVLPDIDAVVMPFGWDRYLMVHEIGTHSILGTVALAALLAWLAVRVSARRHRRRPPAGGPLSWSRAYWAAWAGTGGHVFFDVANGGDIRLFWPVLSARLGGHLVAMADPIALSVLVLGAVAAVGLRKRLGAVAAVTLLVVAGLLCGKLVLQRRAFAHYEAVARDAGGPVLSRAIESEWGAVDRWMVYDRTAQSLRVWSARGADPSVRLLFERPVPPITAIVRASMTAPTVAHAISLFDFGFPSVRPTPAGAEVLWSDIRFCMPTDCVIWFGVQLDRQGRRVQQIVKVGELVQTRP